MAQGADPTLTTHGHRRGQDHDPAPIPSLLVGEGERRTRPVLPGVVAVGLPAEAEATRRAPHGLRHHGTAVAHEATRIVPTAALHLLHHDAAETQTRPARLREGVDRARAHQAVPQVEGTARLSAAEGPARSPDGTADRRLATIRPGPRLGRRRDLDRLRRLRVAEGALIRRHAAAARLRAG